MYAYTYIKRFSSLAETHKKTLGSASYTWYSRKRDKTKKQFIETKTDRIVIFFY